MPKMTRWERFRSMLFASQPSPTANVTLLRSAKGKPIVRLERTMDRTSSPRLLLPDKIKRKLSTRRRGLSPSWDGSLCWEQMHRGNLPSVSLEISIWSRERFRQVMIGYVRLSLSADETDSKSVRWFDKTSGEQAIWEAFVEEPTKRYHCQLPLRLATGGNK